MSTNILLFLLLLSLSIPLVLCVVFISIFFTHSTKDYRNGKKGYYSGCKGWPDHMEKIKLGKQAILSAALMFLCFALLAFIFTRYFSYKDPKGSETHAIIIGL